MCVQIRTSCSSRSNSRRKNHRSSFQARNPLGMFPPNLKASLRLQSDFDTHLRKLFHSCFSHSGFLILVFYLPQYCTSDTPSSCLHSPSHPRPNRVIINHRHRTLVTNSFDQKRFPSTDPITLQHLVHDLLLPDDERRDFGAADCRV